MKISGSLQKLELSHFFTLLVVILLFAHTFFPGFVRVDRYTSWFLAFLFMMVILPSLRKGSIAYLFSFERDLKRAKESVEKLNEKDGAQDNEVKRMVREKMKKSTDKTNPCLTTGKIHQQIKKRLYEIQERWLKEEEKLHGVESEKLAEHLQKKGYLSRELYDAIHEILTICTPVKYTAKLTPKDIEAILETSLPVLERLHELV